MRLYGIATVIMIAAAMLIPTVAAQETGTYNYTVTPAGDTVLKGTSVIVPMNTGSIKQGESKWYSLNVPAGKKELFIDLNWGDTSNSLRLMVYAPDAVLGPYYDAYDGVNGRICLRISDSVSLFPGTWQFEVYGASVTGTQSYTFGWK
ncbi:pre-peptidase C-terminal domain-containing protein [Methanoculleus sp. DTU007]|jgi:hypothetical protein|uniref:pre-peptidase C-terminal domain-containing protein n=1 Tax=Methanoculleus TaxID=45989 RepID=UPI000AD99092|nr:pre-peptidase C-terminal domain-containing protein [Methanoculleus sp. DTU007]NLN09104.1 hypothetical protein [Methanoculleus thermophilus]HQD26633.1 hypothetical protein [Methanoculleus thermophilus]